jgi:hypothetical protein
MINEWQPIDEGRGTEGCDGKNDNCEEWKLPRRSRVMTDPVRHCRSDRRERYTLPSHDTRQTPLRWNNLI